MIKVEMSKELWDYVKKNGNDKVSRDYPRHLMEEIEAIHKKYIDKNEIFQIKLDSFDKFYDMGREDRSDLSLIHNMLIKFVDEVSPVFPKLKIEMSRELWQYVKENSDKKRIEEYPKHLVDEIVEINKKYRGDRVLFNTNWDCNNTSSPRKLGSWHDFGVRDESNIHHCGGMYIRFEEENVEPMFIKQDRYFCYNHAKGFIDDCKYVVIKKDGNICRYMIDGTEKSFSSHEVSSIERYVKDNIWKEVFNPDLSFMKKSVRYFMAAKDTWGNTAYVIYDHNTGNNVWPQTISFYGVSGQSFYGIKEAEAFVKAGQWKEVSETEAKDHLKKYLDEQKKKIEEETKKVEAEKKAALEKPRVIKSFYTETDYQSIQAAIVKKYTPNVSPCANCGYPKASGHACDNCKAD